MRRESAWLARRREKRRKSAQSGAVQNPTCGRELRRGHQRLQCNCSQ